METTLSAIELSGTVNENHQIHLDEPLPIEASKRVRVIVLYATDDDISEKDWRQAAAANPAFAFLNDPAEDIYSLEDGKPLADER
ncbi:MAG TPA: hypothetical protein VGC91_20820 [Pyrinomonadaceae bacterium]|jgi:hypothetical protein